MLGVLGLIYALARLRIESNGTGAALHANLSSLRSYWLASGGLWASLTGLCFLLVRKRDRASELRGGGWAIAIVLIVAAAARLAIVLVHQPSLSDDIFRYVFDGRTLAAGFNPYLQTPAERMTMPDRWPGESGIASQVNNRQLHTIYLPASQYAFAAAATIWTLVHRDLDTGLLVFRSAFACVDLVAVVFIVLLLRREHRSPWWAALYAWHPLALSEIAGSGHQDVLGIALMLAAMLVYTVWSRRVACRQSENWKVGNGNSGISNFDLPLSTFTSALLGVAVMVKPVAAVVALLMLSRRRLRAWIVSVIAGALVCIVLAAPLMLTHDREPLRNWRATAGRFSEKWAHFGSVYVPTLAVMHAADPIEDEQSQWQKKEAHERWARYVCFSLVGVVIVAALVLRAGVFAGSRAILFAMVLFSTTAHPWYLLWALVLLPLRFSPAVWIASLTLPWGYVAWTDPEWNVPAWVMGAAYAPVYSALAADLVRVWRARRTRDGMMASRDEA